MKVKIELDDKDTAETIDLIQRLVTALEKLLERLEDIVEPELRNDV
ncbi:MAG: hypothetical protein OSA95_13160 [Opitutales bacterium]|jgi:hypothetical protein|nr:hypothetical protein [Opitutales bacterium]|tara:strand:+ start:4582 stop:4719 length:138 start_codon:yes stop_codon:yes gene_type:complete